MVLDKATQDKLYKDVQSYRLITVATLVDRLKINGSLARQSLKDLEEKGHIKKVVGHSKLSIYSKCWFSCHFKRWKRRRVGQSAVTTKAGFCGFGGGGRRRRARWHKCWGWDKMGRWLFVRDGRLLLTTGDSSTCCHRSGVKREWGSVKSFQDTHGRVGFLGYPRGLSSSAGRSKV